MGSIPWAARDPIFWLHHCNIDRLWASWNKAGRKNPTGTTFLSKTFTFADENGLQVVGKVSDVLSILGLGYAYSAYEQVPPCLQPSSTIQADTPQAQSARQAMRVLAAAGSVPLASEPVRVKLKAPAARSPKRPFDMRIRKLARSTRVYLVISKLQAAAEPGILYEVYLTPSEEAVGKPSAKHRVGTINFFDAVSHGEESHVNDDNFVSFDVTNLIRRQQLEGRLKAEPAVTIVPAGESAADAKPIVGSIEVIAQ